MKDLSDTALLLWIGFFRGTGSTLSFGGDHAEMAITPVARGALNELLAIGAVQPIPPTDSLPGREYYGSCGMDLGSECRNRPHLNPFRDKEGSVFFAKKQTAAAPDGPEM